MSQPTSWISRCEVSPERHSKDRFPVSVSGNGRLFRTFAHKQSMAADRAAPWSRWDGFQVMVTENPALSRPYYDVSGSAGNQQLIPQYDPTTLLAQRVNTIDPSYYDCIYATANNALNVTQLCYKDRGCCARDCCKDTDWSVKYGWAVALIVVFCILVILAVVITLVIWLFNRAQDKRQKRQLLHGSGLSPATSQMSLARPIQGGYHFGTGPYQNPPDGGYRY